MHFLTFFALTIPLLGNVVIAAPADDKAKTPGINDNGQPAKIHPPVKQSDISALNRYIKANTPGTNHNSHPANNCPPGRRSGSRTSSQSQAGYGRPTYGAGYTPRSRPNYGYGGGTAHHSGYGHRHRDDYGYGYPFGTDPCFGGGPSLDFGDSSQSSTGFGGDSSSFGGGDSSSSGGGDSSSW
ncbi:uncharacterized protein PgNI_08465 [Pyricularia grisea]|uniref:Uncharacterized protein n=1 Tax=Pyricularia grisea TaxID=148305 RepID=A0A6P8AVS0_PYRGI|nr:uncharacterized protein PgNI_08465 [Pyricularia grisea]TLD06326.1 hypothetical protein PgNI_08465 [Pyricularia grisea]